MKYLAIAIAALALAACSDNLPPPSASAPAAAPQQAGSGDWLLPALGGFLAGNLLSGSRSTSQPSVVHQTTVVNKTVNVVKPPKPSTSPSSYRPSYSSSRSSFSSSRSFSSGRR